MQASIARRHFLECKSNLMKHLKLSLDISIITNKCKTVLDFIELLLDTRSNLVDI